MRSRKLQIYLTASEDAAVREAASRAGMTASQYGAKLVVDAMLEPRRYRDADAIQAVRSFRTLFVASMRLSLRGELTAQRFDALVEKVGAEG
jgi:hypothetical protein